MSQLPPSALGTRNKVAATLGLALLALTSNVVSVPLFYGVDFIFGSIAVMLAIVWLGILPAVLVAVLGATYTVVLWGHPCALAVFAAEALIVGLLYRRLGVRSLVFADLIFWLVIGVPLQSLLYGQWLGMDASAIQLIALKQPLNGVFNALAAGLVIIGLRLYGRPGRMSAFGPSRLEHLLFHVMLMSILVAGAIPIVYDGYNLRAEQEEFVRSELENQANRLISKIENEAGHSVTDWQSTLIAEQPNPLTSMTLLATDGRVLASVGPFSGAADAQGNTRELRRGLAIWLPTAELPAMQRWKLGRYRVRRPVTAANDIECVVEVPSAPLVETLERGRTAMFVLLAGLLLIGVMVAKLLSRWLSRPLTQLASMSEKLSSQITAGVETQLPRSFVAEYSTLSATLSLMSRRLAHTFQELRQTQAGLEQQIQKRTAELERLSRVASETTNGVVITNTQGRVEWVNEGFTRLTGYALAEIRGKRPGELLQGENTDPATVAQMRQAICQGESFDVDVINYNKSGEEYWIHVSCNPLRDPAGRLQGFIAIESDITREKTDAERIRASQRRLAAVIEGTNIGTWEWNVLTGETVFNRRWAEMVGYTLEELEPINIQTWLELVHPDDLALSGSELERHFAGEIEHYDVQCRMRHKDGHWIWVHDRGRVVTRTEDGKPLMMYGTHADISKQKHAESELNQFKNTLDGTLDCVFMFDAESLRFNYFNEGALQQIGYDREELLQMHPYDIKPDFTPRQFRELIAPLLNGQQVSITFETVHRRKDGRQWPVEVFLQYVAPANEPARFVAIVRDLTERKEAEAERERIANLLSNVLDAASEVSIIATDLQGTITVFNSGAERMLGYAAEQMIGRTTPALIHLESEVIQRATELSGELGRPVSGFEVFVAHAKQGRSERREWTYVRRDGGHLTVSLVVTAVRDSRGQITGFLGVAEDISERKRRDAALRAAKEAAESASQAKGEFLANMSHELRTPLNAVIGFSEGLLERTNRHPLNDHQKDRLAKIHKSGHHLLSLINDVLDISKIESGKVELYPSTFDLRSLAEEVADISVGAFREKSNVRFQLLLDDGLPQLCSDREKIKQILINLVGNALKFTHQGQVTMNVQQRDDRLLITVQDTGIGIPADQLEKIFDKFHQIRGSISDSVKGTGLGLSICKMLSDLLGATLSMESTVGSGSIVTLSLPANAGSAPGESLSSGKHVVTT